MSKPDPTPIVKPRFDPSPTDGKADTIIDCVLELLEDAGYPNDTLEAFCGEVMGLTSRDELMQVVGRYVELVDGDEQTVTKPTLDLERFNGKLDGVAGYVIGLMEKAGYSDEEIDNFIEQSLTATTYMEMLRVAANFVVVVETEVPPAKSEGLSLD